MIEMNLVRLRAHSFFPQSVRFAANEGLSFAKIPHGLNPFAISAIARPGNKNPDLRRSQCNNVARAQNLAVRSFCGPQG